MMSIMRLGRGEPALPDKGRVPVQANGSVPMLEPANRTSVMIGRIMRDWDQFLEQTPWFLQAGAAELIGEEQPWRRGVVEGLPQLTALLGTATATSRSRVRRTNCLPGDRRAIVGGGSVTRRWRQVSARFTPRTGASGVCAAGSSSASGSPKPGG